LHKKGADKCKKARVKDRKKEGHTTIRRGGAHIAEDWASRWGKNRSSEKMALYHMSAGKECGGGGSQKRPKLWTKPRNMNIWEGAAAHKVGTRGGA